MVNPAHPAKFSGPVASTITAILGEHQPQLTIDPFAGVGGVHTLTNGYTVGAEIEPEWARQGPGTLVADALRLPFPAGVFDALVTSPSYGNRMCLTAGTLILTAERGYVPIVDVQVGAHVLTHTGAWRMVIRVSRAAAKPIVEVSGQVGSKIRCTPDHPILAASRISPTWPVVLGTAGWVEAAMATGAYWAVPASQAKPWPYEPSPMGDTPEVWWAIGFWLANGSSHVDGVGRHATVSWSKDTRLAEPCEAALRSAFGAALRVGLNRGGCQLWHLYRKSFIEWLAAFGHSAATKTVPGWVLAMPDDNREALLKGWFAGDGCPTGRDGEYAGSSVSLPLIRGMQLLAHSIGWSTGISRARKAGIEKVAGRLCQVREAWHLKATTLKTRRTHHIDGQDFMVVRSVEPAGQADVYDLTVEDDHSFVANGVIVHNSDHHEARDPSKRNTYRHLLGRALHGNNSGAMQWGADYRAFHAAAWHEAARVLTPDALVVLSLSNHIRAGDEQLVSEWHLTWWLTHNAKLLAAQPVHTRRLRFGANAHLRAAHEWVYVLRLQPSPPNKKREGNAHTRRVQADPTSEPFPGGE